MGEPAAVAGRALEPFPYRRVIQDTPGCASSPFDLP
jgi:hypothetical protein